MHKRLLILLILCTLLVFSMGAFASTVSADRTMDVEVDGHKLTANTVLQEGTLLAPVRTLGESLGANVEWHGETKKAVVTYNNKKIEFTIGEKAVRSQNKNFQMQVPAQLIEGQTMVPLRLLSEALGSSVNYCPYEGVKISKPEERKFQLPGEEQIDLETEVSWVITPEREVDINLKVWNETDETVNIHMGVQDYEIKIYDEEGELSWFYSDGKAFIMIIVEVIFQPGEKKVFTETVPSLDPGSYSAEVFYLGISSEKPVKTFEFTIEE